MLYVLQNFHYFIILIGPLILFHELGHFLVAKLCGVRVLKFSLGFGPKLIGFKRGETEYVLAAIPLGGFVKMWGEDPSLELPPEEQAGSFSHQSRAKRAAIVAAGPVFNLVLAAFLYAAFFMGGGQDGAAKLGLVLAGEPAAKAGLEAGDEVTAVNGAPIHYWSELHERIEKSGGREMVLAVLRDGKEQTIRVTPKIVEDRDELGQPEKQGKIGVSLNYLAPIVDVTDAASPAAQAGVQTGDEVVSVDGRPIATWPELGRALARGGSVELEVRQSAPAGQEATAPVRKVKLALAAQAEPRVDQHLRPDPAGAYSGLAAFDARIAEVKPGSPAAKAGLTVGDRLVAIDGRKIAAWRFDLAALNGKDARNELAVTYVHGDQAVTTTLKLELEESVDELKQKTRAFVFGAENDARTLRAYTVDRPYGFVQALGMGVAKTYEVSALTLRGLGLMVSGKISVDNVGGPVMLFVVAEKSATRGLVAFLTIMAIISINLGLMNLLPVPVLDGGHLMFIAAETLSRRPLPLRYREYANVLGLVLLFLLMALAFRNDFVRFVLG